MCGFIAQLVEHRTGIAEVTGSNPVEALIFFRLLLSNYLSWKIYCDEHSSLSISVLLLQFLLRCICDVLNSVLLCNFNSVLLNSIPFVQFLF